MDSGNSRWQEPAWLTKLGVRVKKARSKRVVVTKRGERKEKILKR